MSTSIVISKYRERFILPHFVSLLAAGLLSVTVVISYFFIVSYDPVDERNDILGITRNLFNQDPHCHCRCGESPESQEIRLDTPVEKQNMYCNARTENSMDWNEDFSLHASSATENHCFESIGNFQYENLRCGCSGYGLLELEKCTWTSVFSSDAIFAFRIMAGIHVVFVVLLYTCLLRYIITTYSVVLPRLMDKNTLHQNWTLRWLRQHNDPFHIVSLFAIWYQALPLAFRWSPAVLYYPLPQNFYGKNSYFHSFFLFTLFLYALSVIFYFCYLPSSAIGEDEATQGKWNKITSRVYTFFCLLIVTGILSFGLTISGSFGDLYGFIVGISLFTITYLSLINTTWCLQSVIRKQCLLEANENVARILENLDRRVEKEKETFELLEASMESGQDLNIVIRSYLSRTQEICLQLKLLQETHPFIGISQTEQDIEDLILETLRLAMSHSHPKLLTATLRHAYLIGYIPPVNLQEILEQGHGADFLYDDMEDPADVHDFSYALETPNDITICRRFKDLFRSVSRKLKGRRMRVKGYSPVDSGFVTTFEGPLIRNPEFNREIFVSLKQGFLPLLRRTSEKQNSAKLAENGGNDLGEEIPLHAKRQHAGDEDMFNCYLEVIFKNFYHNAASQMAQIRSLVEICRKPNEPTCDLLFLGRQGGIEVGATVRSILKDNKPIAIIQIISTKLGIQFNELRETCENTKSELGFCSFDEKEDLWIQNTGEVGSYPFAIFSPIHTGFRNLPLSFGRHYFEFEFFGHSTTEENFLPVSVGLVDCSKPPLDKHGNRRGWFFLKSLNSIFLRESDPFQRNSEALTEDGVLGCAVEIMEAERLVKIWFSWNGMWLARYSVGEDVNIEVLCEWSRNDIEGVTWTPFLQSFPEHVFQYSKSMKLCPCIVGNSAGRFLTTSENFIHSPPLPEFMPIHASLCVDEIVFDELA